MNDIVKLVVAIIFSLGALFVEVLLDRIEDSSWLIVIIKIVVAFFLIVAIGQVIKFFLECLSIL